MTTNLNSPGVSTMLSKQILSDIDEFCAETYDGGHRNHLGASLIGHDCSRYLWYTFRWVFHKRHDGRQQRLFNRGHREEARFVEWLEGIGCKVWFEDESGNQFRISDCKGHFGGSLDGICILPERYGIPYPVLLEFKTNGTGAGFNKLTSQGMPLAKPQHFSQTSVYGYKGVSGTQFEWCLYLNINKNDDSIHCELVKLNHTIGAQVISKAERVIFSDKAPSRISDNITYRECSWCDYKDVCHKGASPEMNCRSCTHAVPVDNAEWYCNVHDGIIPKDFIPKACPQYKAITENV